LSAQEPGEEEERPEGRLDLAALPSNDRLLVREAEDLGECALGQALLLSVATKATPQENPAALPLLVTGEFVIGHSLD
jgi:hypothetical protein